MTDATTAQDALAAFAYGVPKAELHLHLDGTMEPELKLKLAERNGIELEAKTVEEIRATYRFHDLETFLAVHYPNMLVLLTEEDFYDLCFEYLKKAASQGVRYAEMFFDPQLHTSRGVPFSAMIGGYARAISDAQKEYGIRGELIMCFLRDSGPEFGMATLMESLAYKDRILGVGLDSNEYMHPPVEYQAVLERARAEGYKVTLHCDIDQHNSIEHIRQALEVIDVDRIDHGTNVLEDPRLVDLVREKGIGLTACPLSNGFVDPTMKAPEIMELFNGGVLVTLNSDDPPYFNGYVGDNFVAMQRACDLGKEELAGFARNSFLSSWLPDEEKAAFIREVDAFVAGESPAGTV